MEAVEKHVMQRWPKWTPESHHKYANPELKKVVRELLLVGFTPEMLDLIVPLITVPAYWDNNTFLSIEPYDLPAGPISQADLAHIDTILAPGGDPARWVDRPHLGFTRPGFFSVDVWDYHIDCMMNNEFALQVKSDQPHMGVHWENGKGWVVENSGEHDEDEEDAE